VDTAFAKFMTYCNATSEKPQTRDPCFSTKLVLNPQTAPDDDNVGQSQPCFGLCGHKQMTLQ